MGIPQQLRGERILLRGFIEEDAARLSRLAGDRRIADTMISVPHPYPMSGARQDIRRFAHEASTATAFHFAVCQPSDSRNLFGYVALRDINHAHESGELSFWIDERHSGKGYITEAARTVLHFAFDELRLNRVCAHAMVRNVASERVLAKIGMRQEGCLRQMVKKWKKYEDVSLWAILRADLRQRQRRPKIRS